MTDSWQEKIARLLKQSSELRNLLDGEISHPEVITGVGRLRLRLKGFLVDSAEIPKRLEKLLQTLPGNFPCGLILTDKSGAIFCADKQARSLLGADPTNTLLKNAQAQISFLHGDMETPYTEAELPWTKTELSSSAETNIPRILLKSPAHPQGRWIACSVSTLSADANDKSKAISLVDMHELVSREKELAVLAKSMDRLIADMENVSSEFKQLSHRLQTGATILVDEEEEFNIPRTTERPPVVDEEDNGNRTRQALIVDDIPVVQKIMDLRLRKLHFTCDYAKDGKEAIEKSSKTNYDLIFMDCNMPGMDGFEAAKQIRRKELETGKHVPIIAMTAYDRPQDRARCLSAGMDEYIDKGTSTRILEEIIDWCMHRGDIRHAPPVEAELDEEELDIAKLKESYSLYELSDLLNSFVQGTNTVMRCLRMAIDEKEVRSIAHFAYSLKGPFATLGLLMTARLTATLTDSAETNDWIDVDEYYDSLAVKCKLFLNQVDEFNSKLEKAK